MRRRRFRVLAIVLSLLTTLLLVPAQPAQAASGYVLTASYGTGVTTTDKAIKLRVTFKHNGKKVKKAKVSLQYLKGTTWVTEKKVTVKKGKGSVTVKHSVMNRTYRFSAKGKASKPFAVHFVPATFTIKGSGFGHGVGMAQWGAYELSRTGASTADILGHYYPGTTLGTAYNNPRTVKVQVLGPPADSRKTTALKVSSGGFTVSGDGAVLKSYPTPGTVSIGVSGSKVTAKVTLANGKVRNQALRTSSRLTLTWKTGPVTVTGAQGSYQAGNLQVTVIAKRPNVVNQLAMNTEYLYGIDEMPSSWGKASAKGAAALRAQVVAARNYVITEILRLPAAQQKEDAGAPGCDCHVYDDTRSQNFTGWKKAGGSANQPWVDAVKATIVSSAEVQVLRDPSKGMAETPYYASSGRDGGTASNADVFGTAPLTYLTSVKDPYSAAAPGNPNLAWTRTIDQAKAKGLFGVKEPVVALAVTSRYPGGLVQTVRATTLSGKQLSISKRADTWRTALGLPGAWVASVSGR